MLGAIYGVLSWLALMIIGRLVLVRVFKRTAPGPVASVAVGLAILIVCAVPLGIIAHVKEQRALDQFVQQDRAKKAKFLAELCAERRAKGQIPGAGC